MKKIYKVEVREEKSSEGYENKRYNVHSFELCRTVNKAYLNKKLSRCLKVRKTMNKLNIEFLKMVSLYLAIVYQV